MGGTRAQKAAYFVKLRELIDANREYSAEPTLARVHAGSAVRVKELKLTFPPSLRPFLLDASLLFQRRSSS